MAHMHQFEVGQEVLYKSFSGDKMECGTVTAKNALYVFVQYPSFSRPVATNPSNLTITYPTKHREN